MSQDKFEQTKAPAKPPAPRPASRGRPPPGNKRPDKPGPADRLQAVGNRPSTTANAGRRGQIASRESAGSSGVAPNRPVTTDGEVNPRHGNRTSPAGPWVRGITNELLPSRGTCLPDLVGDKAEAPRGRDIAEDPIGWAKWQGRQTAGQTNFATG